MFQNGVVSGLSCFEGLLRGNFEGRRIYDAYAQTLIDQGKFDESIKVYESTLQTGKPFVKSGVAGRAEEYKALRQNKKFDPEPIASEAHSFGKNPSCRIRPWVSSLMG